MHSFSKRYNGQRWLEVEPRPSWVFLFSRRLDSEKMRPVRKAGMQRALAPVQTPAPLPPGEDRKPVQPPGPAVSCRPDPSQTSQVQQRSVTHLWRFRKDSCLQISQPQLRQIKIHFQMVQYIWYNHSQNMSLTASIISAVSHVEKAIIIKNILPLENCPK